MDVPLWPNTQPQLAMHDRLRLTQAKMPDEVQLELLAPWYTQNTSESRTLDFFDAIPKYPFAVTTTIPKPNDLRCRLPFGVRSIPRSLRRRRLQTHGQARNGLSFLGVERNSSNAHSALSRYNKSPRRS